MNENIKNKDQSKATIKKERLLQALARTQKQLAIIQTREKSQERLKRTRALITAGGVFSMVNPELVDFKSNERLYNLMLGTAIHLNEMLKSEDAHTKDRLVKLEEKAKAFIAEKKKSV